MPSRVVTKNYDVVIESGMAGIHGLKGKVAQLTDKDWECQGGICVIGSQDGSYPSYYQAMVKKVTVTTNIGPG